MLISTKSSGMLSLTYPIYLGCLSRTMLVVNERESCFVYLFTCLYPLKVQVFFPGHIPSIWDVCLGQ